MKKKVISAILIAAIIISSVALSLTAFASSQELKLNVKATTNMSGVDDLEWFYFTPDQSGTYSFMSFNTAKCDGYLFTREVDPVTYRKEYKQLAYAGPYYEIEHDSDKREEMNLPHYKDYDRNEFQFCLTYHLEAGTRYYFAVSWFLSNQTRHQFDVMLVCDSYDNNSISSIEIIDLPELNAYSGGEWKTDEKGNDYYYYSLSRIITNVTIKINYLYGESTVVTGKQEVDGYQISYLENQNENHWYPQEDENYSGNKITVKILDKEAEADVSIAVGGRYSVQGRVVNLVGEPVKNALVSIDGVRAYTNADGKFNVYASDGYHAISISTDTSIDLNETILVSAGVTDLTSMPFELCNCDVVRDDYINAKDYSAIIKHYSGEERDMFEKEFKSAINFSKNMYS